MTTAIKCGLVGFVAGVCAALMLTVVGTSRPLSPDEIRLFWPTAILGVDFTDWADGNVWHFLRLLFIFAGNGLVYAVVACGFGALAAFLRDKHL